MKNYKLVVIVPFILIIGCSLSCKKKGGANPSNSKIAFVDLIHYQSIQHYHIVYNAVNNVDSIISIGGGTDTGHNGFKKFNYYSISYTITDENNVYFNVRINPDGSIAEVLKTDALFMKYSGSQLSELDIKSPISSAPFYMMATTNYYWQGGDIYIIYTKTVNDTIDYDQGR